MKNSEGIKFFVINLFKVVDPSKAQKEEVVGLHKILWKLHIFLHMWGLKIQNQVKHIKPVSRTETKQISIYTNYK